MQDRVGMEAPGLSLFQGSDSIHINAGTHRQEEEEEQEDLKRRDEEIKDLLTNAFDDLEDDDASSMNSSHFHDASRDVDHSGLENCSIQPVVNDKGPTISQYRNDFGIYASDGVSTYKSTPYPQIDDNKGPTISDMQREFGVYGQLGTPLNNNKETNSLHSSSGSPYELPRPPKAMNSAFPHDLRAQINDGLTLLENYPHNYNTPSNHYDGHNTHYPNNGYIGSYENNIQNNSREHGAGDHDVSSEHYNHCYKTSPNGRPVNDINAYKAAEYNSKEQLEVLYSVRMREIKQLTEELQRLQVDKEEEKSQLSRKLALAQAEIERTNLSRDQAQNALVDAKAEIIELQTQVSGYKEKIAIMEKTNQNMAEELSTARNSVMDLQQKIAVLERVQSLQANDKTHEKFLKQAQEKHTIEMNNMQKLIDNLNAKLNEKESLVVTLERKLADLRRTNESLMVEKGETMNRLAQQLEESQAQCRNLMATNNAQEIMQLQSRIRMMNQERDELLKTVQNLQHKLDIAKIDTVQYDSLLTATMEDESDSIKQMNLGVLHNNTRGKSGEDITTKLRGELQRCIAGQGVKRKEIQRLENIISEKDQELEKAHSMTETCQQEAARYAKRVNELEQELKSVITEQAQKAKAQIQRLSDHLTEVRSQKETLMREKHQLQHKLEETLANQDETIRKLQQETLIQQEKEKVDEYNKEYLEIHDKAIERIRQEAQLEMVQLTVQLEQTQKELQHVKELYIDVCGTKEQLIHDHKNEMKMLNESYANLSIQKHEVEQLRMEFEVQTKLAQKLSHECESHKKIIVELERDLSYERKKKAEYTKKIHEEIERAKEEALAELRNSHPERQISFLLPDHCSEHSDKISQLEDDCRRLEEKLSSAVEEQRKMTDLQMELDDMKIKIAQMEIAQASLKKKHDNIINERNDLIAKLAKRDSEIVKLKKTARLSDETDEHNLSIKIKLENETLKSKCDSLLKDRIDYKTKIAELESQLNDYRKKVIYFENNETLTPTRNESERELNQYKELVNQLAGQLNNSKSRKSDYFNDERIKQLEHELNEKEAQLQRLKDLEKIQDERDKLVTKLKNQAKQFEQYVKSQKQVSAELNLSPRSSIEGIESQKIREMSVKIVREEMELKLAEQLRLIEAQHCEKQKNIEENYKSILTVLNGQYADKTRELEAMKEAMISEKQKLQSSFKTQEQIVVQMIEAKLRECKEELLARKTKIEQLQMQLVEKTRESEETRNLMSQYMTKWVPEVQNMEAEKAKMQAEINELRENETKFKEEIDQLKQKNSELKSYIEALKKKYQSAKTASKNYKELAESKEEHALRECKRIQEGCQKVINQVHQNYETLIKTNQKLVDEKMNQLDSQYEMKLRQLRQKMKYKDKS